jgi:hypothetical protein
MNVKQLHDRDFWIGMAAAGLILAAILVLTSCTLGPPKPVVPDVPALPAQKQTVTIPSGLIADCDPMTKPDSTRAYTQGQSLDIVKVWRDEYTDCASRLHRFVAVVTPVLNINEAPAGASAAVPASAASQ